MQLHLFLPEIRRNHTSRRSRYGSFPFGMPFLNIVYQIILSVATRKFWWTWVCLCGQKIQRDSKLKNQKEAAPVKPLQVERGDTLANVLRRHIADDILSGKCEPGTRLDERSLANEYGVSRTPVREALQQLAAAGLVSSKPHSGTIVQGVEIERVASLCEASILLESLCAKLAASRISAVEIGRLRKIHEQCETLHKSGDAEGYALANRKFHSAIISGTQNTDLIDAVEFCRLRIAPFQRAPFQSADRRAESQKEHKRIIEALEARDAAKAEQMMSEHLSAAAVAIDDHLQNFFS
ncbi:MAG: GntR family transcriptional regulator [Roseibium sp.]|uniref:GntR family transcriptional regulator n=1 Tax=Roseibium sp. TaxID=1936156 RepID=UPI0026253B99|nr:GntR family transcriptional regulator [Roseibium sp.]MCV0424171.1 GntR family transcriptional regulator [Roseibium sp.]